MPILIARNRIGIAEEIDEEEAPATPGVSALEFADGIRIASLVQTSAEFALGLIEEILLADSNPVVGRILHLHLGILLVVHNGREEPDCGEIVVVSQCEIRRLACAGR